MKKFLVCVAKRLTPKMRRSLKMVVGNNRLEEIKGYCRERGMGFDIIPITKVNVGRLAVVLNQVKSVKQ